MKKMKWLFVVLSILLLTALIGCKPQLSAPGTTPPGTVPPGTIPPAESDSDYFELLEGQQPGRAVQTINTVQLKAEYRPDGSKYDRLPAALFIPKTISGKIVQGIAPGALKGVTRITAITIPEGIVSIGPNALEGCTALKKITIPESVRYISAGAFKDCSSVTTIEIQSTTLEHFDGTALATGGTNLKISVTSEAVKSKVEEEKQNAISAGVTLPTIPPPEVVAPGSVKAYINSGINNLSKQKFDEALKDFNSAYSLNKNDDNAKFFYALAQMGSISVKQEMADFMRERLGVKNYPQEMNALINGSWMTQYPTDTGNVMLPEIDRPGWFNAGLIDIVNGQINQNVYWMYLLANALDKNPKGLNTAVDQIRSLCFGTEFETAVSAVNTISKNFVATLTQDQLRAFGLDGVLGEAEITELKFGKAEILALFGGLELVKGVIETLGSFNLDTDLTFLLVDWYENPELIIDQITAVGGLNENNDIFNNGFLNRRYEYITYAKGSYIGAATKLSAACALYEEAASSDMTVPGLVGNYIRPVKRMIDAFKNSASSENAFYFPKDGDIFGVPTWPESPSGTAWKALDFAVLFNKDRLTLKTIVELENVRSTDLKPGSQAPKIYKITDNHNRYDLVQNGNELNGPCDGFAVKILYKDIVGLFPFMSLPETNLLIGDYLMLPVCNPVPENGSISADYRLLKALAKYYHNWQ